MGTAGWQVLADCPHCLTESSVVEWMDPDHGIAVFGLPSERRCRMCGWQQIASALPRGDGCCPNCRAPLSVKDSRCAACGYAPPLLPKVPPADLTDPDAAISALRRWAEEEGESDLAVFCVGSFGCAPEEVVQRLAARAPVPTTFDAIAHLFRAGGNTTAQRFAEAPEEKIYEAEPPPAESKPAPRAPEPRTPARVLASVMLADGRLLAVERRQLAKLLTDLGAPPLSSADLRVWHPFELDPPEDKEMCGRIVEAAVHLMYVDGYGDENEKKVIDAIARRFNIDPELVERWEARYESRYVGLTGRVARWWRG